MNNYSNNNYSDNKYSDNKCSENNLLHEARTELATPQTRAIAFILDAVLMGLLLGVGWFIWFLMIAGRGTTPGHDLMGQVIVDAKSGKPATFGKMFIRECLVKGILSMFLASMTMFINYIVDGAFLFREDRRTLHDHLIGTDVVQSRTTTLLEKLESL